MQEYRLFMDAYSKPYKREHALATESQDDDTSKSDVKIKTFVDRTETSAKPGQAVNDEPGSHPGLYDQQKYIQAQQEHTKINQILQAEKEKIAKAPHPKMIPGKSDKQKAVTVTGGDIVDVGFYRTDPETKIWQQREFAAETNVIKEDATPKPASTNNAQSKPQTKLYGFKDPKTYGEQLNKEIDGMIKNHKAKKPDSELTYTYDPEEFDKFLNEIWPTNTRRASNTKVPASTTVPTASPQPSTKKN